MIFKKFNKATVISLCSIAVVIAIVFPLAIVFANKVPNPISINSEEDFYKINERLDGFYLVNNFNFTKPIKPIGDKDHPFTGRIEGFGTVSGNLEFDLNDIDLEKYTVEGKTYIGLFAFNEGTIIRNNFALTYSNFTYEGDNDLYIGGICGYNKGKVTSNRISSINGLTFSSNNNITFGGCVGFNDGEVRRNSFIGHFNIRAGCNNFTVGQFAGECSKNSVIEMCRAGSHLSIYNNDELSINNLNAGIICGKSSGGKILNVDLESAQININSKHIRNANCGGFIGNLVGTDNLIIKDSYYNASIISNGIDSQYSSLGIGNTTNNNLFFENILFGGRLSSNNSKASTIVFSDIAPLYDINLTNCYLLDSTVFPSECIKNINNKININELSLKKLNWSDAYWDISNGKIIFKALNTYDDA